MSTGAKTVDAGVEIGQLLLGKYRVDGVIGHGGMGVVVECTHMVLGGRYAIKMLRKDVLLDEEAVQRFDREAKSASRLKSEYVAKVTDVGFQDDVPFMVMEFLEGHNLGELLEQRGTLPIPWASELILQTCEALAEAHSLGIVHRDVKPTNLFVTWRPDGSALVKVLDFGISKSSLGTDMNLTQTQSLLGTPAYMSPEQMRSARLVDWRSDIWSLGSVFYELLEGRRPFEAESFSEMCVKVAVDPPAPMTKVPPELEAVVMKCLAKAPEQRYSTMAELANDLVPFVVDQHHGAKLVERMTRMLRRSQHSFDDMSTSDIRAIAAPNPDVSARFSVGSEPFARPIANVGSAPVVAAPSTTMDAVLPRRRMLPIVIGVGALAGVGIALAVAFGGGSSEPKQAAPAVVAPAPVIEKPAAPVEKPPEKPVEKIAEQPVVVDPKPAPLKAKNRPRPHVTKSAGAVPVQTSQPASEIHEPAVKTVAPVQDNGKPCDPFKAAHGCPNK